MPWTPLLLPAFPDAETALIEWIVAEFPPLQPVVNVDTVLPNPLKGSLPFVRVAAQGGQEENIVTLSVPVEIDVYSTTRDGAYDLIEGIQGKLLGAPHRIGETRIDRVVLLSSPVPAEWPDNDIRRFIATYRLSLRRR